MENYLKVIIITMIILMLLASSLFIFPPSTIACNLYSFISIPFRPEQVKVIRNLLNSFQFIKKKYILQFNFFWTHCCRNQAASITSSRDSRLQVSAVSFKFIRMTSAVSLGCGNPSPHTFTIIGTTHSGGQFLFLHRCNGRENYVNPIIHSQVRNITNAFPVRFKIKMFNKQQRDGFN